MSQIIHPLDKTITARIFHEGTDQIYQDVICYVRQDEEADWTGDRWLRIVYTNVEIKMPLYIRPDAIKQDIECALEDNGIDFQNFTVEYRLAPNEYSI